MKANPVSELNRARNSQGTNPRTGRHCSQVLYVVMGCSGTSVLSTRRRRGAKPLAVAAAAVQFRRRRCGVPAAVCCGSGNLEMDPFAHSHVHRDGYTYALVCKYAKIVHSSPYNFDYSFLEVLESLKVVNIHLRRSLRLLRWPRSDRSRFQPHKNVVYLLPKEFDDKVAKLHFLPLHSPYSGTSRLHRRQV